MMWRDCIKVFAVAAAVWPTTAQAQTYPSRPIVMVVPYAAGGTFDVMGPRVPVLKWWVFNLIQIAVLVTENGAKKVESIRLFARPWPVVKLFRQCMERTCVRIRFPTPSGIFQQPMRGDEDVQATGAWLGELQSSVSARPASCGCLGCFLLWQA
jgi:hypothetical protein